MPMGTRGYVGAILLLTGLFLSSCSKEDSVMLPTASQVDNQEVCFDFFEESIASLNETEKARTRASGLKQAKLFTELEVCLIPINSTKQDSGYVVRQDSIAADFGTVKMQVPSGEYTLIAVAAKTNTKQGHIKVLSPTEMTFPDNNVTDMAYATKTISITKDTNGNTQTIALKRGVSCFTLKCNDNVPEDAASEAFTITGSCGVVFNPTTGFCKESTTIQKELSYNAKDYQTKKPSFNLYVLLGSDNVTDLKITAVSKDTSKKEIKTCSFENVGLTIGMKTTYTGPIFTFSNSITFSIGNKTIDESKNGKTFQ